MRHVIYPTLTEKTLVGKVPQLYLFGTLLITMFIWFLFESLLLAIPIGLILWGVGVIYTRIDPDFAEIILMKRFKLTSQTKATDQGNRYLA